MTYGTALTLRSASQMAQRFCLDAVSERREWAVLFIEHMESAIERGIEGGMDKASLRDLATGALDLVVNTQADLHADLDKENLSHDMVLPLDVSELKALAEKVGAPKFPNTSCSQCGEDFGPGNHGYSHCDHHAHKRPLGRIA